MLENLPFYPSIGFSNTKNKVAKTNYYLFITSKIVIKTIIILIIIICIFREKFKIQAESTEESVYKQ
jgi:hypothetical protein